MAICRKAERAVLTHEEWMFVDQTHHPALGQLDAAALADARQRLRTMRARERGFTEHKGRVAKGKAEMRGGSFPGTADRPRRRKQVFAHALRRVNSEAERREARASRAAIVESQHRALARKRAAANHRPGNRPTAGEGARAIENRKARAHVSGKRVGSTSQQMKAAQARRDG
jgi:hypothetical protein